MNKLKIDSITKITIKLNVGKVQMNKKDKLYDKLIILDNERRAIEKELAVLESENCQIRFSLCLDCAYKNNCPRYRKHREESRI